ncbi:MAG: hypothetical protein IPL74_11580 [Bacteroidetes bacterium]|nr:hypothetical protein [Bacteroidota bacterium]
MMFKEEAVKPVTIASSEKIIHTSLPDSTHIVVNRNSELEYVFTKDQRKVALKGEAFLILLLMQTVNSSLKLVVLP